MSAGELCIMSAGELCIMSAGELCIMSACEPCIVSLIVRSLQDKIHILSSSTQTQVLLDEIGPELVPRHLGGEFEAESETSTCDASGYITPMQQEFDEMMASGAFSW
jgi:hypothetical protein